MLNLGYMLWCMGIEWNFYFSEGKFISWKEGLVYERKIWSMKRRYCLRKEDFVYEIKVLFSYIALHMHIFVTKWTNYEIIFLSMKGRFFSTKGRFYLRKEGFIIVNIVVLTYTCICYKINKLLLSTKGRFLSTKGSFIYERKIFVGPR